MKRKISLLALGLILLTGSCLALIAGGVAWIYMRPQPGPVTETLFNGVVYERIVRRTPRPVVIHIVRVDLRTSGVGILVTPGDPDQQLPLKARTTSQFLSDFKVQVAINGDGFQPWHSRSILNYYPHSGDRVDVIGTAIYDGISYSSDTDSEPTLYFGYNNQARVNTPATRPQHAISGNLLLVRGGQAQSLGDSQPEPRTAAGLDQRRNELILVVVDGRQPGYSQGLTLNELSELLVMLGVYEAINLDGGGSSTLVVEGNNGRPQVLNSPINHGLPGRERAVGNHLGIYAQP
jgi:hypothetical protein